MHLGNGAVTPECGLVALGVAALGVGAATLAARAGGIDRARARTAGALGSAVFAAQLFNVPIVPFASVHLIGGVLLAWVLSPALGAITMACILMLQAMLLGDGGLLTLGVNIVNMSLLPAVAVALVRIAMSFDAAPDEVSGKRSALAIAFTALACTVGAAGLIVLEVSLGREPGQLDGLGSFASQMILWHTLAGVLEAAASVALVFGLARIAGTAAAGYRLSPRSAAVMTAASLLVAVLPTLGFSSATPDGYGAALASAERSGLAIGGIESAGQLAGLAAAVQHWQGSVTAAFPGPEVVTVVLATALAGLMAWSCARASSPNVWNSIR